MLSIRIFSLLLIALSFVLVYYALGIKVALVYEPVGPLPFPLAILILIACCSGLLLFFSEKTRIQYPSLATMGRLGLLLVSLFGYAYLFEILGFLSASVIFIFVSALIFEARLFIAFIFAVLCSLALFYLFDVLLQITLPRGEVLLSIMSKLQ